MLYAQVIEDFGWDVMKNVLSSYEKDAQSSLPNTDQEKIDVFWSKYSLAAKENLTPLLDKFKVPFSENFTNKVKDLPLYV